MTWAIVAFLAGGLLSFWLAALLAAARDDEWRTAYLNCRDRLWALERDEEHA